MVKKEKLFNRIKSTQKNVRFGDFCTLMEYFGFKLVRTRGSHHLYQHPTLQEVMNVQPNKENQAKAYQVRQFLKLVESYDLQLEEEPDE